jgi:UDP-N-acetylmuramoyl-tripeptide--D-alanyl-D-alanine ligase
MDRWTAALVISGTGGELLSGKPEFTFSGVSIDTRSLQPGDLFFAIRGPNNDGHRFVETALEKGAAGSVVDESYSLPSPCPEGKFLLRVNDTHKALKDLAGVVRLRWAGSLVAITGSMGKTTTKEFAAQVLESEFSIYRSPGNLNNLFGLPLALFGLREENRIGIFEMGMSAPGEIAEMCRIARPDIGIITNVAPVHLQFFPSVDAIAEAKGELAAGLPADGLLIYNRDDVRVRKIAESFKGEILSIGFEEGAAVQARGPRITGLAETRFELVIEGKSREASIPLAGSHFVRNALPGIALAIHFGVPPERIREHLNHLHQASMRGQVLQLERGFTIIDDSYNSNPQALMQMIETLCRIPEFGRRILVAGEMLELGPAAEELHYGCGRHAAECGVDLVVAVRGLAREIARGAAEAGLSAGQVKYFDDPSAAGEFLEKTAAAGDLILFKASRAVQLEKAVRHLQNRAGEGRK